MPVRPIPVDVSVKPVTLLLEHDRVGRVHHGQYRAGYRERYLPRWYIERVTHLVYREYYPPPGVQVLLSSPGVHGRQ